MSDRKRCCCNCRHNIRYFDEGGMCYCYCEIDRHYIGYVECFEGWCRRWAKGQVVRGKERVDADEKMRHMRSRNAYDNPTI